MRPDFYDAEERVAIYVDGPPHDHADQQTRDAEQQRAMEDLGYIVLRFRHDEEWGPQCRMMTVERGLALP